jgi:hypothetical protein
MGRSLIKGRSKLGGQPIGYARFHQEGGATLTRRAFARGCLVIAGHDHNRNVSRPRIARDVPNEIPPVEPWEQHLRDDDVGMCLPRTRKGVRALTDGGDLETERRERRGVEFTRIVVAVREKNQRSGRRLAWAAAFHDGFPGVSRWVVNRNYSCTWGASVGYRTDAA